mmetsp:Transcript_29609/g.27052  ORF Transcript_29609/g.27052 Transcript_29609/m.27052 type:complete len:129 (-) Transcript_29609:2991-3377(-)
MSTVGGLRIHSIRLSRRNGEYDLCNWIEKQGNDFSEETSMNLNGYFDILFQHSPVNTLFYNIEMFRHGVDLDIPTDNCIAPLFAFDRVYCLACKAPYFEQNFECVTGACLSIVPDVKANTNHCPQCVD